MSDDIVDIKKNTNKPTEIKSGDFDFEYWAKLSKEDPQAFEAARKAEIDKHIESLDEAVQERMVRFQWRIEMERKLSKNPLDSAARLYDMMWESVGKNMTALDELTHLLNPKANNKSPKVEEKNKNILSFVRNEKVLDLETAE